MRRRRVSALAELPIVQRAYLETGDYRGGSAYSLWFFVYDGGALATWRTLREPLLAEWALAHPGTRPFAWWQFDAPRTAVDAPNRPADREMEAQRARVGGVGTPAYEVFNQAPRFEFGLPVDWVTAFQDAYYNGRARDVYGERIGVRFTEGHFAGVAPRLDDPPRFESQATFLERHGLLSVAERRNLQPDAFDPERLVTQPEQVDPCAEFPGAFDTQTFDETQIEDGRKGIH